jgi:hypothetical protein
MILSLALAASAAAQAPPATDERVRDTLLVEKRR